jgi:hypothetical protein
MSSNVYMILHITTGLYLHALPSRYSTNFNYFLVRVPEPVNPKEAKDNIQIVHYLFSLQQAMKLMYIIETIPDLKIYINTTSSKPIYCVKEEFEIVKAENV